jgi:transposase
VPTDRSRCHLNIEKGDRDMVILGIDAHKRIHTVVVIDERGREVASKTTKTTTTAAHLELVRWAERFGPEREWAVEDCRHLSRRLEADLLAAGERIRRVPPKLMAKARDSARTNGKSDPIDALAVARAALREPDLPMAQLDGPARELRLLVDHREDLVKDRTGPINRLRWHLHELDPSWDPPARTITSYKTLDCIAERLQGDDRLVARIAADLVDRIRSLTVTERALQRDITERVNSMTPCLLALVGVGPLIAAKIVAEPTSAASNTKTPSPATTAPLRYRRGPGIRIGTGSPAPATVNSTPPSTASPSPSSPTIRTRKPSDASPRATPEPKPCEPSSDDSQTSSSEPCSSTQNRPLPPISPTPLDIGADDTALAPIIHENGGGLA